MYFLPFSVIIVCTLFTVKKIISKQPSTNNQLKNSVQRNRRVSIMLLLMCLMYIISTLPNRLCFSIFADQIIGHEYTDTVFLSSNTLMYTREAMNVFFLYISLAGFRRDIRNLMLRCLGKRLIQVGPPKNTMIRDGVHTIMAVKGKHGMIITGLPAIIH
jgi:hypothetical protein